MIENHNIMTDPELYAMCKKWGAEALEARRKFVGLLPEVFRRRLFERRGFNSIYHFAAELGGVGEQLVNEVLRLEKRFEAMPNLHLALVKGEIGMSKLARIASVVEIGNEAEMCEKIRNLSRRAVDVLVKDMRGGIEERADQNGLFEIKNEAKSLAGQTRFETVSNGGQASSALKVDQKDTSYAKNSSSQNHDFEILAALSPEVKAKLKELIDKDIDVNAVLLTALEKREEEIAQRKAEIGVTPAKSRYIPVLIKKVLRAEFGRRCSVRKCHKLAEQIHHEKRFALYRDHDPRHLKPICRGHHELTHVK